MIPPGTPASGEDADQVTGILGQDDLIKFDPEVFGFGTNSQGQPRVGKIELMHGQLTVSNSVVIDGNARTQVGEDLVDGPGWQGLTIDASQQPLNSDGIIGNGARVFSINGATSVGKDITLRGLSVTGGDSSAIAATVWSSSGSQDSTLTLSELRVHGNASLTNGGGISVGVSDNGQLHLDNLLVDGNSAGYSQAGVTEAGGGGVHVKAFSNAVVEIDRLLARNNRVVEVSDDSVGGGLFLDVSDSAQVRVKDSLFSENVVGGLVELFGPDPPQATYNNTPFHGEGKGGGVAVIKQDDTGLDTSDVVFDSVSLVSNTAYGHGGGLYQELMYFEENEQNVTFINGLILDNRADLGAGAYATHLGFRHSTIAGNKAGHTTADFIQHVDRLTGGGGVMIGKSDGTLAAVTFDSTIVAANTVTAFPATVTYSNGDVEFQGGLVVGPDIGVIRQRNTIGTDSPTPVPSDDPPVSVTDTVSFEHSILGSPVKSGDLWAVLAGREPDIIRYRYDLEFTGINETGTGTSLESTNPRFGDLTSVSSTHFLDCTRMPVLPILDGSPAIDFGDDAYTTSNYPSYEFNGQTPHPEVTNDLRGLGWERIVDAAPALAGKGPIDAGSYEYGAVSLGGVGETTRTTDIFDDYGDTVLIYLDTHCLRPAIDQLTDRLGRDRIEFNDTDFTYGQFEQDLTDLVSSMYGVFPGVTVTNSLPMDPVYDLEDNLIGFEERDRSTYDTITFHPGASGGLLGSSGSYFGDYRNEWTGDISEVYPNQFGVLLEDLGHDEATSDASLVGDLIPMLAGTAAHEHGHTAGLQHYDPYGDHGSTTILNPGNTGDAGIDPNATLGNQNLYLMATGSTGLTAAERAAIRTFSPLSVAKLEHSYGFSGTYPQAQTIYEDPSLANTPDGLAPVGQEIPIGSAPRLDISGLRSTNLVGSFNEPDPSLLDDPDNTADVYWFDAYEDDTVSLNVLSASMRRREFVDWTDPMSEEFDRGGVKVELFDGSDFTTATLLASSDELGYTPTQIGEADEISGDPLTEYWKEVDEGLILNTVLPSDGRYWVRITQTGDDASVDEDYELLALLKSEIAFSTIPLPDEDAQIGELGLVGDFNHNDVVNGADYVTWRDALGAYVTDGIGADIARDDPNSTEEKAYVTEPDGLIDKYDYYAWAANYGAITGKAVGDYNADGVVNMADYDLWAATYGNTTDLRADGSDDSIVNAADYVIWRDTFDSLPEVPEFGLIAVIAGDFNADGNVDQADLALWEAGDPSADADGDGDIDWDDHSVWRERLGATTFESIDGDFNGDGIVDTADHRLWVLGSDLADANGDGVIDLADYNVWDANFGRFSAGLLPQIVSGELGVLEKPFLAPAVLDLALSSGGASPFSFSGVVGSGDQIRSVPVTSPDTVSITFSEEVFVTQNALLLTNLDGTSPGTVTDFSYDLTTQTASWTFDAPFADGRTLLTLSDSIYDLDGEALDGDFFGAWSLSETGTATFPTGDGDAGGEFRFHFTVLAGDANHDNIDGATDYTNWHSTEPGAIYVSTLTDEFDPDLSFGDVSLREAVDYANNAATPTTVYVPEGLHRLTLTGAEPSPDIAVNDLDITGDVSIRGRGPGLTHIRTTWSGTPDGWNARQFTAFGGAVLNLSAATFSGGASFVSGQTLYAAPGSTVSIEDSAIAQQLATKNAASVAAKSSELTIRRSVFTNAWNSYADGAAVDVYGTATEPATLTIGESLFALNDYINNHGNPGTTYNVRTDANVSKANEGKNLIDDDAGGFFDTTPGVGDYLGVADYVVTSIADTLYHGDNGFNVSVREAIDLANQNPGSEEVWLPAWNFELTRDRQTYGGGSATDTDIAFGDLDIKDQLIVRGTSDRTRVAWKPGVVDSVFDLLGDANDDELPVQDTNVFDYSAWGNQDGSGSGTSADWEVYSADFDDDGDVDAADYAVWSSYYGNSLDLFDIELG